MHQHRGFTLWELIVTTAIAATIAGLGIPALNWLVLDLQLSADTNALVSAIQLARGESAKRRQPVVMCNSVDGQQCSGTTLDGGWIIFPNANGGRPPIRDANEPLLLDYTPVSQAQIRANRRLFEFRPFLRRSTNGTITLCDRRGLRNARRVIISYTGRPRTSTVSGRSPCP